MADPMTRDKLRDLLSDMVCGIGEDGAAVMDAVDELIGQECAEVVRLRSQLAMHLTAWRNAAGRARKNRADLGDARGALWWVEYQLSKHAAGYGGDIEDAYDTAREALGKGDADSA